MGLCRFWALLSAADVAFLLAIAAASAALLAWRRAAPRSPRLARHRELPAAALRLAIAASPTAWTITQRTLAGSPPYDGGPLWNAVVFGLTLVFCSFGATATVLVRRGAGRGAALALMDSRVTFPHPCFD